MPEKPVTIVGYAAGKARRRGITHDEIVGCVSNPDQLVAGRGERKVAQKLVQWRGKEYLLRVIFEEYLDRVEVVTAYRTSEITRYWEGPR